MRSLKYAALLLALTLALVIAACGEESGDSTTGATSPATPATGDAASVGKLSANNATAEELEAAFAAAGISNPGRGLMTWSTIARSRRTIRTSRSFAADSRNTTPRPMSWRRSSGYSSCRDSVIRR